MRRYHVAMLCAIVVLGAVLRLWDLGGRDIIGDESVDAFRSIGYLDYLGTSFQTQPVEWYENADLPRWTRLSFHDAPPFAFLVSHVFFRAFGDSLFVARLPSALWGIFSILLLYAIVRRIFRRLASDDSLETLALITAALLAIGNPAVSISRTAILDGATFGATLLAVYCFLKFLDAPRYWWAFGASLAIALLVKYTAVFLAPVFLVYLLIGRRDVFRDWRVYAAVFLALIIFSPVIIYNIELYRARGHFDLQIAYALGQATPEWTGLLGKVQAPFRDIGKNLPAYVGWMTPILAVLGAVTMLVRRELRRSSVIIFIGLYIAFATLLLLIIGSAARFLTLYAFPFAVLGALSLAWFLAQPRYRVACRVLVIGLLLLEFTRTVRINFFEGEDYGIAALDRYLTAELRGTRSAAIPESTNRHLNDVIQTFAERVPKTLEPQKTLIIYNDNVALGTLEWIFYRRFFYHVTPTLYVENFLDVVQTQGSDYFNGFTVYFIASTPATELNPFKENKKAADVFEEDLRRNSVPVAASIQTRAGIEAFRVYKFEG
ncbi:MAG: glycosyltransferase family 39 protein [bacterium]|nr:glycosyltransferase family 39 protein [bacterium]